MMLWSPGSRKPACYSPAEISLTAARSDIRNCLTLCLGSITQRMSKLLGGPTACIYVYYICSQNIRARASMAGCILSKMPDTQVPTPSFLHAPVTCASCACFRFFLESRPCGRTETLWSLGLAAGCSGLSPASPY